jgi:hypothetical protein
MKDTVIKYIRGLVKIAGEDDSGQLRNLSMTGEGHAEVAIHDPLLPFGSVHAEKLTPVFQSDAVYGINSGQEVTSTSGSGSVAAVSSSFVCSTGTTIFSQASIQSRKRLRYRAGQGVVARFAGSFTTPVASSYQVMGVGHPEDGYFFAYQNTTFGILKSARGVREVQTLTVTVGSSTNENITVTLNGVNYSVAVTNTGSTLRTAYEISQGDYGTSWKADAVGSTVIFVSNSVGNKAGAFSITASTAAGTFAETTAGAATTDTFIAQADWNGDKLDGTGPSGVTLDPTKGNVYQIGIQYLGYGAVIFKILVIPANRNNAIWITVHTIKNPNNLTDTHVGNPSFPFTMAVYSAGSTTNLSIKCGSFAGFVEGEKKLHGNRFTYVNSITTVGATNLQALFTFKNRNTYASRANQSVVNFLSVSGAVKHTQPVIFYLIRNGILAGTPNFTAQATNSCCLVDTAATTVTYSSNDQLMWTGHLGETGEIDHHFSPSEIEEITLQPGEWITLAAKAVTGTPAHVTGSINTREDQ